jgi:signal transduction histidine kinase
MAVNGERRFTGILHDLSGRIRMEEQLREQAAMARLGEMAAVIAHEVKNPLAGVRGAIQVIGSRLPKESKDAEIVKEILTRIDGLNELMKDLLLFARPPQPRPAPVDVRGLIHTTADLLARDPALKDVVVTVEGGAPPIAADAELLKIVFQNLLMNGARAMHGNGAIQITLAAIEGRCRITVHDGGPGIPADVRARIFTPFFTTKARGTGLGLPTAKRIVEAHGGSIAVRCPAEGGTTVDMNFPLSSEM